MLLLGLPVKVAERSLLEWKLIFLGLSSKSNTLQFSLLGYIVLWPCLKLVINDLQRYMLKDSESLAPTKYFMVRWDVKPLWWKAWLCILTQIRVIFSEEVFNVPSFCNFITCSTFSVKFVQRSVKLQMLTMNNHNMIVWHPIRACSSVTCKWQYKIQGQHFLYKFRNCTFNFRTPTLVIDIAWENIVSSSRPYETVHRQNFYVLFVFARIINYSHNKSRSQLKRKNSSESSSSDNIYH